MRVNDVFYRFLYFVLTCELHKNDGNRQISSYLDLQFCPKLRWCQLAYCGPLPLCSVASEVYNLQAYLEA